MQLGLAVFSLIVVFTASYFFLRWNRDNIEPLNLHVNKDIPQIKPLYLQENPKFITKNDKGSKNHRPSKNPHFKTDSNPRGSPNLIDCICPATGLILDQVESMNEKQIDSIINNAERAFKLSNFTETDPFFKKRLLVLKTLQKFVLNNQVWIAKISCRDSGKTLIDASMGEILVTLEKLNWLILHGPKILKNSNRSGPTNFFMKWLKIAEIRYEPLGVVTSIVSWNYPFHNLMGPVIASILTGNSIVVKCSEQVIWSSKIFINLVQNCLIECNVDPNLVQLCYCLPPRSITQSDNLMDEKIDNTANFFTSHPKLKHITFIGSDTIGKKVLSQSINNLTPVVLELGGKDSFIVLDSYNETDLFQLTSIILRGTFQSSGQNCIGIERVIVSQRIYHNLVKCLEERLQKIKFNQGSDIDKTKNDINIDIGAMISSNRFQALQDLIDDAIAKGAKLIQGGKPYSHPLYPLGNYFEPTVLIDVTTEMQITQMEVFGPILVIMKAKDTNHCIEIANTSNFGLGASVFGNDTVENNFVTNNLRTGNVAINDFATFYVCQLPFGGINNSGFGKFGGKEGLRGICNAKSVCLDRFPFKFLRTQIPKQIDYPINDHSSSDNGKPWRFVSSFITASYTYSLKDRLIALKNLIKESI